MAKGVPNWTDAEDEALMKLYRGAYAFQDIGNIMAFEGFPSRSESQYRQRMDWLIAQETRIRKQKRDEHDDGRSARKIIAEEQETRPLQEVIDEANNREDGGVDFEDTSRSADPAVPPPPKPKKIPKPRKPPKNKWTDAEIAQLRLIASQGHPASEAPERMKKAGFRPRTKAAYQQFAWTSDFRFKGKAGAKKKGVLEIRTRPRRDWNPKSPRKSREAFTPEEDAVLKLLTEKGLTDEQISANMAVRGFPVRVKSVYKNRRKHPEYQRRAK